MVGMLIFHSDFDDDANTEAGVFTISYWISWISNIKWV